VTNPTRTDRQVTIALLEGAILLSPRDVWGDAHITRAGSKFTMNVPARDAVVMKLEETLTIR
jgi:hypothetical protein